MVAHVINQPLTGGISGLPEGVQSKVCCLYDHFSHLALTLICS